jgi:gas vesicle protein
MHTSPLRISRKGKTLHYGSHGRFSCHRAVVSAEYRRGGAGAGDFVAGFLLGGVVFGALGYLLAPQITKSISEDIEKEEEDGPRKRPARFLEDDEGLEKTRKNLNEKIAQLNAAIDDVSAQLRSEDGFGNPNETTAELESAAWWILRGGRKSYLILTAVWCAAMLASLSIVVQQWAWKHQCTPHGYRFFC